jgi:hypothetical protein
MAMTVVRVWQVGLVFATAIAVSGCAAMHRHEARGMGDLLVAAGFSATRADTPEQAKQLRAMPPLKMIAQSEDGHVVYRYADPYRCDCLYVGDEKAYREYKRLVLQRQLAADRLEAESAAINWPPGRW